MAKPHSKALKGLERGRDCIHWYDFIQSRRQLLKHGKWQGSRTKTKPGTQWVSSDYLVPDLKKLSTWGYMQKKDEKREVA